MSSSSSSTACRAVEPRTACRASPQAGPVGFEPRTLALGVTIRSSQAKSSQVKSTHFGGGHTLKEVGEEVDVLVGLRRGRPQVAQPDEARPDGLGLGLGLGVAQPDEAGPDGSCGVRGGCGWG
jgi:hypothetical protein